MNLLDQYLLFRVRSRRDAEAYAKIYDRYVASIYRFVFLKLPSKEQAEDVTSETFLRTWQYLLDQSDVWHVRALLYQVARNLVADFYRKISKEREIPLSVTLFDATTSSLIDRLSDDRRGQTQTEARAEFALVMRSISRLKEDYQDVLLLRYIDGLPFEDIARILNKNVGNVRVLFHRASKALDHLLEKK